MTSPASDPLTLSALRAERTADLTTRNLMEAIRLTYELRARYRVFEFEAEQEGHKEAARMFAALSRTENDQVSTLMRGLRLRLAVSGEQLTGEPA